MPTIHGQGDETDESFNTINKSISLKPETLHEDPIKNVLMKSNTNKKMSTRVNDISYSSNISSIVSWLNNDLSNLAKVNI